MGATEDVDKAAALFGCRVGLPLGALHNFHGIWENYKRDVREGSWLHAKSSICPNKEDSSSLGVLSQISRSTLSLFVIPKKVNYQIKVFFFFFLIGKDSKK